MSDVCLTIRIKTPAGDVVINESDFDAATMTRADIPPPPAAAPVAPPPEPQHPLDSLGVDWHQQDYGTLRDLVVALTGRTVENQAQAVQVIRQLLAERAAA